MKVSALAAASIAAWSAGAIAAEVSSVTQPVPVRDTVAYVEALYRGEVVAIELDAAGDKAAHYHVDLRYPGSVVAPLEVDATSLEAQVRHAQPSAAAGWTTLGDAAALAARQLGTGEVIAAQLDATDSSAAHYEVDIRLPAGQVARLKVDPQTQALTWRVPAIASN
jgi:uncharacterized membrane protein YkoI